MALSEPAANDTIVLVPIRSFDDAKSRLAGSLDPQARRALMRRMAETVVSAAHDLPVWVVTDDDEVTAWATELSTSTFAVGVNGLNPAITVAATAASRAGASRILVAHADLPYASDLRVVTGNGVAIAPDRHRDGSNVMSLPTNTVSLLPMGLVRLTGTVSNQRAWDSTSPRSMTHLWLGMSTAPQICPRT